MDGITGWDEWPQSRHALLRWAFRPRNALSDEVEMRHSPFWPVSEGPLARTRDCAAFARVYADVRSALEARKQHHQAAELYAGEMEMRRLGMESWRERHLSMHALYGAVSLYGARWTRPLMWFALVVCCWALLYQFQGLQVRQGGIGPDNSFVDVQRIVKVELAWPWDALPHLGTLAGYWGDSLLHSLFVASFVARDQAAIPLTELGRLLQFVESLVGPLLAGLMALAIRKQYSGGSGEK